MTTTGAYGHAARVFRWDLITVTGSIDAVFTTYGRVLCSRTASPIASIASRCPKSSVPVGFTGSPYMIVNLAMGSRISRAWDFIVAPSPNMVDVRNRPDFRPIIDEPLDRR